MRAAYLLDQLNERARAGGADLPIHLNTALRQHHSAGGGTSLPGDPRHGAAHQEPGALECHGHVVRQNKYDPGIGGHISTYASLATLLEVGFNHFFHAGYGDQPGDLLYSGPRLAGRLRARFPRRAAERRAPEELPARAARTSRPLLLSASLAHAGFWRFPTVSMGLDPSTPSTRRASCRYWKIGGLIAPTRRKSGPISAMARWTSRNPWVRSRWPRARSWIPHLRHQLQSAAAGWAGARQRQGDPGTGGGLPRSGLERRQVDLGRRLG